MIQLLSYLFRNYYLPDSCQAVHDLIVRARHIVPFVGYPLHRNEQYHPFFIVGSGRSGNTLLRRILCTHPSIHIPPETYRLGPAIKLFRQNRNLDWKRLVHLVLSEFEYHPQFDAFGVSLRPLALLITEAPPESRSLALILDRFYCYHAETTGKTNLARWGDKTPINVFWLETISTVFPEAQFIHLIRDGCDVVSSYLKSGLLPDMNSSVERWVTAVKAGQKFATRHQAACLEIRYEDLVLEPAKMTRHVCAFLGIEYDPLMIHSEQVAETLGDVPLRNHHSRVQEAISQSSIGKGRRDLDLAIRQELQERIGRHLERLGYAPCI